MSSSSHLEDVESPPSLRNPGKDDSDVISSKKVDLDNLASGGSLYLITTPLNVFVSSVMRILETH